MTEIEKAKQTLKDAGYYVDNLWHINDVKKDWRCTDKQSFEILDKVFNGECFGEVVFDLINIEARIKEYKQKL
jgi:hypothetical protein